MSYPARAASGCAATTMKCHAVTSCLRAIGVAGSGAGCAHGDVEMQAKRKAAAPTRIFRWNGSTGVAGYHAPPDPSPPPRQRGGEGALQVTAPDKRRGGAAPRT